MLVQQVWFAQSSHSNANSNDENLTCTSVHDSNLRQNMQGLNQNIIHYVEAMLLIFTTSPPLCAHTETHTHVPFFQVVILLILIPTIYLWDMQHPDLLGPVPSQVPPRVLPHTCVFHRLSSLMIFTVVFASWWLESSSTEHKKIKNRKAGLSSNAKTSVGAFMVSHMEPGYFAHVSAFPQRCPHIICVQPCHLHRSVCTHTYKKKKKNYIHISMLSWVCERQMGVNWKRV